MVKVQSTGRAETLRGPRRIYPSPNNGALRLTPEQVSMIELFGSS